jgi:dsDNA-specific endonuclease/ATPase MutS2
MPILKWIKRLADWQGNEDGPANGTETEPEVDPFNPFLDPVIIEITDVIDLHTIPPRDVKRVVEEYLQQAHDRRFRSVRIIHGKGIGVQREMVRSILARTPFVSDWTDAPPEAGGLGATIVRLAATTELSDTDYQS